MGLRAAELLPVYHLALNAQRLEHERALKEHEAKLKELEVTRGSEMRCCGRELYLRVR